jgi:heme/copper-type cytochrome/quinol oxidase subunit 1
MAMTDTRPDTDVEPSATPAAERGDVDAVLGTGDHKTLGRLWIALSSLFLVAALVLAVVAGIERFDLASFVVVDDAEMYAQLWSLATVSLLFLGVVPLLIGVATYVVPLQVGASTLAFPRGAAAAFWCWLASSVLLVVSTIFNGGPGGGRMDFTSMWVVALGAVLVSLLWALVCVLTTIIGLRAQGMSLDRAPLSAWSFLVFGAIGLATLPLMVGELLVAYLRVRYGDLDAGPVRVVLTQVTDTVGLAPGIYWVAIPALGLMLEMVTAHAGTPLRQHRVAMSLLGLFGLLAFGGYVLSYLTLRDTVALDNGLKVLQVLVVPLVVIGLVGLGADSLRRGRSGYRGPLLAGLVSGAMLLLATLVVLLAQVEHILTFVEDLFDRSIDIPSWLALSTTTVHDGVRVLVIGSALVAAVGAVQHWGHKIYGRALDPGIAVLAAAAIALGTVLWGVAEVVSGLLEQPREPLLSAAVRDGVELLNVIATLGAAVAALGVLAFAANLALSTLGRRGSVDEPWRGLTLEWATPSPPPPGNFPEAPVVRSATPLADLEVGVEAEEEVR